jgi:membrane-bound serine protease (ClpP class)
LDAEAIKMSAAGAVNPAAGRRADTIASIPSMQHFARAAVVCVLALISGAGVRAAAPPEPASAGAEIVELRIDGDIEPVMAEYVVDGIAKANASGAALILITIDTPGGLDTSMRTIIQHILDSRAPVAVYVSPSGSRAASAGFFILLSADIAVMAPGTHTGAASPLAVVGGVPVQLDDTLRKKILNDATAYLRSYAGPRRRNIALAETAVTDGKAFTEHEALDGKLIDLLADSHEALLAQLDGRTITRFSGAATTLELARAQVRTISMTARQRLLARIVQPDVFFILLIIGALGLYTEFTHPGLFAPGVLGAIAIVLALFAMHLLPINFAGLLLIVLALGLFVLEANYPTHGVLGVGGAAAMLLGALMLVRSPITGGGVSLGAAAGATLPFAVLAIALTRLVIRSRAWPVQTGVESMRGETAEVVRAIEGRGTATDGDGMIRVRGELWRARARVPIAEGARVRVVAIDGLTVHVEPMD